MAQDPHVRVAIPVGFIVAAALSIGCDSTDAAGPIPCGDAVVCCCGGYSPYPVTCAPSGTYVCEHGGSLYTNELCSNPALSPCWEWFDTGSADTNPYDSSDVDTSDAVDVPDSDSGATEADVVVDGG